MRFQVPQNVDIEDTIFWGLTFKQIIYIMGSFGIFSTLYLFVSFTLAIIVGIPVTILGLMLAFYKHNGKSFITLLYSMIQYVAKSRLYIWKKDNTKANIELVSRDKGEVSSDIEKVIKSVGNTNIKNIEDSLGFEETPE